MNIQTGEILRFEREEELTKALAEGCVVPITRKQERSMSNLDVVGRKNYMRNQPCVCGSGAKFKKCCWSKYA